MARTPRCFGKSYMRTADTCTECRKNTRKTYNDCRLFVMKSLKNTYTDNNEVVRMTLDDIDWEFYCKKVLKKTPKTQYGYRHYITIRKGRKKKIIEVDDGIFSAKANNKSKKKSKKPISSGVTDNDLSQFFTGT